MKKTGTKIYSFPYAISITLCHASIQRNVTEHPQHSFMGGTQDWLIEFLLIWCTIIIFLTIWLRFLSFDCDFLTHWCGLIIDWFSVHLKLIFCTFNNFLSFWLWFLSFDCDFLPHSMWYDWLIDFMFIWFWFDDFLHIWRRILIEWMLDWEVRHQHTPNLEQFNMGGYECK